MTDHDRLEEKLREQKHAYDDMPKMSSPENIVRYVENEAKGPRKRNRQIRNVLPFAAGIAALFLISALVLSQFQSEQENASQNAQTEQHESSEPETTVKDTPVTPDDIPNSIDETRAMFEEMDKAGMSQAEIDEMFVEMMQSKKELFEKEKSELLQLQYDVDDMNAALENPEDIENEELQRFVKNAVDQGLGFENREGMLELVIPYDRYEALFSPYVSETMATYLELQAKKIKFNDGYFEEGWHALGEYLIELETYLESERDFVFGDDLRTHYMQILHAYLFGTENRTPYNHETNTFVEPVKNSYQRMMESYPDSETARVVQMYYDEIEQNDFQSIGRESFNIPRLPDYLMPIIE